MTSTYPTICVIYSLMLFVKVCSTQVWKIYSCRRIDITKGRIQRAELRFEKYGSLAVFPEVRMAPGVREIISLFHLQSKESNITMILDVM
jgi:membrane protein DedA with SNARE-associated domain